MSEGSPEMLRQMYAVAHRAYWEKTLNERIANKYRDHYGFENFAEEGLSLDPFRRALRHKEGKPAEARVLRQLALCKLATGQRHLDNGPLQSV